MLRSVRVVLRLSLEVEVPEAATNPFRGHHIVQARKKKKKEKKNGAQMHASMECRAFLHITYFFRPCAIEDHLPGLITILFLIIVEWAFILFPFQTMGRCKIRLR